MMNTFTKWMVPLGCAVLGAAAFGQYGWPGLVAVAGGVVMWLLLHFTRMMTILRRAADRPVGYVASAVMLNAKLKRGVTLLHVVAMTRSLGAQQGTPGVQPEVHRWTDGSGSYVDCTFTGGTLSGWQMVRPTSPAAGEQDGLAQIGSAP